MILMQCNCKCNQDAVIATAVEDLRIEKQTRFVSVCALGVMLAALGCNDTRASDPVSIRGSSSGSLYAINTRVFVQDLMTPTSYIALVDELDRGEASLDQALELPGGGSLWGVPGSGELYVVSTENLTVTKYRLDGGGELKEAGRIGLSGEGISALVTESLSFDGPDRGYLFDMFTAQAVELDLDAMEITGTHDLSALRIKSSEQTFLAEGGFQRHGDKLVAAVYGSSAQYDHADATSKVGFFDPSDGSLEVVDAPCGGLVYSFTDEGGDRYFATDPWVAAINALDESRAPAPCVARLPADSDELAPETIALNDVTGGVTGGIIPGSEGTAYVRVLDTEVFPLTKETDYLEPFSAQAWQTWRIELPDGKNATKLDRPHIAGGIKFARVGDKVYQNESKADFSSTTLVVTSEGDEPRSGLVVPGVPWNIVQVR
jgi:hypothetical protein